MKIAGVKQYYSGRYHFIKLETDEGLYGIAEATLRVKQPSIAAAVELIVERIQGEDIFTVEKLFHKYFQFDRWRGGVVMITALTAVETAMWDIIGKMLGEPICNLLGGKVREAVPIYASAFNAGCKDMEEIKERAKQYKAMGIRRFKVGAMGMLPFTDPTRDFVTREMVDQAIKRMFELREAVGEDVEMSSDFSGRLDYDLSLRLMEGLEEANVYFIEEPVITDDFTGYRKLSENSAVPLAAGERWFTRYGHRPVLEQRIFRVIQPDFAHCGGLAEAKKMAANAELFGVPVAPHNSNHILSTLAALHVDATIPNFYAQEYQLMSPRHINEPFFTDEFKKFFTVVDGCISMKDIGPGLGLDLDIEAYDLVKSDRELMDW